MSGGPQRLFCTAIGHPGNLVDTETLTTRPGSSLVRHGGRARAIGHRHHLDFQHLAQIYDQTHPRAQEKLTPVKPHAGVTWRREGPVNVFALGPTAVDFTGNQGKEEFRGTTIVSVRRHDKVASAGDGQVSIGNTVMKGNARKVRTLANGRVIAMPPFPPAESIAILDASYKRSVHEVFSRFDREPLAAASIAQVHSSNLQDGIEAIVKVLRPSVRERIEQDLDVLYALAGLAAWLGWGLLVAGIAAFRAGRPRTVGRV